MYSTPFSQSEYGLSLKTKLGDWRPLKTLEDSLALSGLHISGVTLDHMFIVQGGKKASVKYQPNQVLDTALNNVDKQLHQKGITPLKREKLEESQRELLFVREIICKEVKQNSRRRRDEIDLGVADDAPFKDEWGKEAESVLIPVEGAESGIEAFLLM